MPQQRVQRVQDAVHGLMEFCGLETAVVDVLRTAELQRLKRIRQLGLSHLVFPAAEHSRMVHSLGAAHLAIRFAGRLEEIGRDLLVMPLRVDQEARRDLAVAALCHDLGHGPLSHAWEREVIGERFDRQAWADSLGVDGLDLPADLKWHELVGQALLVWPDGELHQLLESHEDGTAERIRSLLAGDYYLPYLPRLLAGDVDVDRCDFIARDALQTGVEYGRYDLAWLVSMLGLGRTDDGQLVAGFDRRKAPRVLEQLLIARRALYDTVYQHKTVRSAEGMIGLLLRRLNELDDLDDWLFVGEMRTLFSSYRTVLDGRPLRPAEILPLDDYSFWSLVAHIASRESGDGTAIDLARRITRRDLFKEVRIDGGRLKRFLLEGDGRDLLYPVLAKHCPGEPRYYMHVDHRSFEMSNSNDLDLAYLVDKDTAGEIGDATRMSDHPDLKYLFAGRAEESDRLFVPREAHEPVAELLHKRA